MESVSGSPDVANPAGPAGRMLLEVALVLGIGSGAVAGAQALGPATPAGNAAAAAGILLTLVAALALQRTRGQPWAALGLGRPASWPRTIALALAATVVIGALALAFQAAVVPLVSSGKPPDASRFDALRGNLPALLGTLLFVWLTAAVGEEIVYRGFLMGRLARLFGGGRGAWLASLVVSSTLFGLLHLYQGLAGVLVTGFVGLLLGALYLLTRRNLWVGILAHGLIDTVSLTLVYAGFGG